MIRIQTLLMWQDLMFDKMFPIHSHKKAYILFTNWDNFKC